MVTSLMFPKGRLIIVQLRLTDAGRPWRRARANRAEIMELKSWEVSDLC